MRKNLLKLGTQSTIITSTSVTFEDVIEISNKTKRAY